jgi:dienelactone hydrolase
MTRARGSRAGSGRLVLALVLCILVAVPVAGCGGEGGEAGAGLFGYDHQAPLDAEFAAQPAYAGDQVELGAYSGDHDRVPAFLAFPPGEHSGPCVIYMHGLMRSKEDAAGLVGTLAGEGIGLLAIDAPYHGARSQGTAELEHVVEDPPAMAAMVRQTVIDLRRGLDLLASRPECDPHRLGFIGFSYGALTGAMLSGADTRVHSTVLLSGGAGWGTILSRAQAVDFPGDTEGAPVDQSQLSALTPFALQTWVARIAPRPVLIANGLHDEVIPRASQQAFRDAAGEGSELIWWDGGHDPFAGPQGPAVLQRILDFFRRTLVNGG